MESTRIKSTYFVISLSLVSLIVTSCSSTKSTTSTTHSTSTTSTNPITTTSTTSTTSTSATPTTSTTATSATPTTSTTSTSATPTTSTTGNTSTSPTTTSTTTTSTSTVSTVTTATSLVRKITLTPFGGTVKPSATPAIATVTSDATGNFTNGTAKDVQIGSMTFTNVIGDTLYFGLAGTMTNSNSSVPAVFPSNKYSIYGLLSPSNNWCLAGASSNYCNPSSSSQGGQTILSLLNQLCSSNAASPSNSMLTVLTTGYYLAGTETPSAPNATVTWSSTPGLPGTNQNGTNTMGPATFIIASPSLIGATNPPANQFFATVTCSQSSS